MRDFDFNHPLGALAYTRTPPAIVQTAIVKNNAYHESKLNKMEEQFTVDYFAAVDEWKVSGAWKEKYPNWNAVLEGFLHVSKSKYYEARAQLCQVALLQNLDKSSVTMVDNKPLTQSAPPVEKAREKPAPVEVVPPCVTDAMGFPIPKHLLDTYARADEITKLMTAASQLKCFFDAQQEHPDLQFKGAFDGQVQTLMKTEGQIHFGLSQCRPDVVCPSCDGKAKTCHDCRETGFISSHDWNLKFVKSSASWIQAKVAKRNKAIQAL